MKNFLSLFAKSFILVLCFSLSLMSCGGSGDSAEGLIKSEGDWGQLTLNGKKYKAIYFVAEGGYTDGGRCSFWITLSDDKEAFWNHFDIRCKSCPRKGLDLTPDLYDVALFSGSNCHYKSGKIEVADTDERHNTITIKFTDFVVSDYEDTYKINGIAKAYFEYSY